MCLDSLTSVFTPKRRPPRGLFRGIYYKSMNINPGDESLHFPYVGYPCRLTRIRPGMLVVDRKKGTLNSWIPYRMGMHVYMFAPKPDEISYGSQTCPVLIDDLVCVGWQNDRRVIVARQVYFLREDETKLVKARARMRRLFKAGKFIVLK